MATTLYNIGDVVYLRESAGLGFLESIKVSAIYIPTTTRVVYYSTTYKNNPCSVTFGDRITHVDNPLMYFEEDELITYELALSLVEANTSAKLAQIQRLQGGTNG